MATTRRMFSNADAIEMLQDAVTIVDAVNPPDDLRAAAFGAAISIVGQRELVGSPLMAGIPGMPRS